MSCTSSSAVLPGCCCDTVCINTCWHGGVVAFTLCCTCAPGCLAADGKHTVRVFVGAGQVEFWGLHRLLAHHVDVRPRALRRLSPLIGQLHLR